MSCVLCGCPHHTGPGGDHSGFGGTPVPVLGWGIQGEGAPLNPAGSCSPLSLPVLLLSPQVFTLPKVSAKTKFKLTAHEGCRVRKVALVSLASAGSEERLENCLACLTNLGDIHIFTVPSLRPQVHYSCIRKEDISGIASCVFTKHGQGEDTR